MIRPLKELEEELEKTDPKAYARFQEAKALLMKAGPAMLNDPKLQDPGGALCGKLKVQKSLN